MAKGLKSKSLQELRKFLDDLQMEHAESAITGKVPGAAKKKKKHPSGIDWSKQKGTDHIVDNPEFTQKLKKMFQKSEKLRGNKNAAKKKAGGGKVGMSHQGLYPAEEARADTMSEMERVKHMKKGGQVKKKKKKEQGYKARKDESIAMRVKKKRTKKQLKASRDESYGKWGSKAKKRGKINRSSSKGWDGNREVSRHYDS